MNREFRRSELALLRLFKRAQLNPSSRFYEQMARAPWAMTSPAAGVHRSVSLRLAATALAVVVLLALIVPLTSLAQQVFHFFTQAETDTVDKAVFLAPTFEAPALNDLTNIEQASAVAGFAIRLPQELPGEIQITAASVNPGSVSVTYSDGQTTLVFLQGMKTESSSFYVGAGAKVEAVPVDGVMGEYVRGGWQRVGDGLVWDNNAGSALLFWEKEGVRYGLLVEAGEMARETLIRIADSLSSPK